MNDALLRTLTSAAAGLLVYFVSGLIGGLDPLMKVGISGAVFVIFLVISLLVGRASRQKDSSINGPRYFSGLRAKRVTVRGVRGPALANSGEFLSEITAKDSIHIDDAESGPTPPHP